MMKTAFLLLVICCTAAYTENVESITALNGAVIDLKSAASVAPFLAATGAPASADCNETAERGRTYFRLDGGAGQHLYVCANEGGSIGWIQPGGLAPLSGAGQGYLAPLGIPWSASSATAYGNTNSRFYQFVPSASMTVTKLAVFVNTAGGSGTTGLAGALYDSACNVIVSGTTQTGLNVIQRRTIPLTSTTLLAGTVYHLGLATDDATVAFAGNANGTLINALFNDDGSSTQGRFFTGSAATGSGSGLTMPSSCGTKTMGSINIVYFGLLP